MANIKYSDLIPDVLPKLAGDPSDPVTENAIKRAVIELCAKSWIWQYFADPLDVAKGESTYDIEPPQGAEVAVVVSAAINGTPIEPKQPIWLDENEKDWRTVEGVVKYFTQVDTDQIILAPPPSENSTGGLTTTLALQPSMTSTSFPKWIATKYLDEIVDGTLARLLMIPKQAWSDPVLAKDYESKFASSIANAREDAVAGLNRSPNRTTSYH